MQTVCENPFFVDNVEKFKQYPYLDKDLCCEIFIVSGGIDGENNLGLIRRLEKENHLLFSSSGAKASSTLFVALKSLKISCQAKSINMKIYFRLFEKMTISEFLSKVCTFQEIL